MEINKNFYYNKIYLKERNLEKDYKVRKMNKFLEDLKDVTNYVYTENGALAHKTTNSAVYDMFALGAAYRVRSNEDCILLFKNAFEENETLALKCLFYLRDIRGGQGERRFFRTCFKWLCDEHPEAAKRNLINISEYGRWDDLIYAAEGTDLKDQAFAILKNQLALDLASKTPSLLGKWLPSENASSKKTKKMATAFREYLDMTHKQYRKILSTLRQKINIVERLMSENRWDEIEFDKIPSKAGLVYRNAFARRDILAKKYEAFMKDKSTKVNATSLFPYEIVEKAIDEFGHCYYWRNNRSTNLSDPTRLALNKYWENLPDYLKGEDCSMMCVVDTSGSMCGRPIAVAISLGLYCAERIGEPFKNYFISFSREARLIKTEGIDFVDKVQRIYDQNLCENTNLDSVFNLLRTTALRDPAARKSMPKTIVVISDMEIDGGSTWGKDNAATHMERIRQKWEQDGLTLPHLVYWNVESRNENKFLDSGDDVTFVSGCSPVIFQSVLTGKTGYQLCLEVLNGERYNAVK